ncbi:MAG: thiamine diphosphokinase [Firmicutes bacterium HGW-Firmicutes-21]|nr:MAG: thiamine diphosphokinase [Firmicutes bacterium HGW-Firmicutes-21]
MRINNITEKSVCYIIGAMSVDEKGFSPKVGDFVIAADGGYMHLHKMGYKPDLLVGDFDSLGVIPEGENIIRLPKEKNDTDTLYAVKLGMEKGYRNFIIYGGIGGRLDHTIANIQTLAFLTERKCKGFLVGEGLVITAVKDSGINFTADKKGVISVFCNGGTASGVYLTGLKYPLTDACLTSDMPLGVSNEFIGVESRVAVEQGTLIIIWNEKNPDIFG